MIKINIPFAYTEAVIPPRCRKPRRQRFQTTITLKVFEVTAAAAPIAIREHAPQCDEYPDSVTNYHWWQNRLWVKTRFQRACHAPYETQTVEQFQADPYPYRIDHSSYEPYAYHTAAERRKTFKQWARRVLFIDGIRYECASEPRYVIMTFGLGGNHGLGWGTALCTDASYNANISRDRYFRIDQYQAAVAEASRIALARGDTKALPITTQRPTWYEIFIPDAVRLKPPTEHTTGSPFINQLEGMIQDVRDPTLAGIGVLGLLSAALHR